MDKIASPTELQSELRRLLAFASEGQPSREKLASEIRGLANRVARGFDPGIVAKIKRLTNSNNHTEANLLGAQMLGATALVKKLQLVVQLQDLEGYMPEGLNKYRYTLYQEMMDLAKRQFSDAEYQQFYSSF